MKKALDSTGRSAVKKGQRGPNKQLVCLEGDGTLRIVRASYKKCTDKPLAGGIIISKKQFNMAFTTNEGFFSNDDYYLVASINQILRHNEGKQR
jgi:hypothetical protein